jgi:hypothetical protein
LIKLIGISSLKLKKELKVDLEKVLEELLIKIKENKKI